MNRYRMGMINRRLLGLVLSACAFVTATAAVPEVTMLVPGFTVEELPVHLSNQNNLRFAPDGTLTSLGYDGRVWKLRDTDGDGLEDKAEAWWDKQPLTVPLGMCWTTKGLYVSSSGKVSLLRDSNGDGKADTEEVVSNDWPDKDVASGNVDATAVTMDPAGNVYFGLLVQNYANAYRLTRRNDLKPADIAWLKAHERWIEPKTADAGNDEFSLYDIESRRGTIQKLNPRTKQLSTIATGIRVPVGLAFNQAGDLFNTDQEGETWMPDGNPLDELNLIVSGHNYGFPPRHPRWLPTLVSDEPIVAFGPQHQSSCGLVFNEPHGVSSPIVSDIALPSFPAQGLFGPSEWEGNVFVAGESRGKIWRVQLVKSKDGHVGRSQIIARFSMLVLDVAISPKGDLYVCCHSGPPDWGTGPQGPGKIFKIHYNDPLAPQPLAVWPASSTEVRIAFNRPLAPAVTQTLPTIEFGEYVTAGDRLEVLTPPYAAVEQQAATPRGHLAVQAARLEDAGRTLVLETAPHPLPVRYAITIPGVAASGVDTAPATVELDYDLTASSTLAATQPTNNWTRASWNRLAAWAPAAHVSSGTVSRPSAKPTGDWENGHGLFVKNLQCAQCHHTHGEGGTAGPDLSNLVHRDVTSVLRDIRDPNATLHPEYVTYEATLKNGDALTGFLRPSKDNDSVVIADVAGLETVIPRANLVNLHPTGKSLMPTGLLDAASETEVRDLLTYLMWEPPIRTRAEAEKLVAQSSKPAAAKPILLVLVASKQDHGPGQHDYPHWQEKWLRLLAQASTNTAVEKAWEWPTDEQFAKADALVFYFWNHDWSDARHAQIEAYQKRGGGLVFLHSAVISDNDPKRLAEQIGLAAQPSTVLYRHMPFQLELKETDSVLTRGLPNRIQFIDEPYWPMIGDVSKVSVVATAHIDDADRPLVWTLERGQSRVFASILGHYFWTLDDPIYRVLVLRGIAWAAHADPERLTQAALIEANLR
jgi:putative heme-binding domain-containing protein